MATHLPLITLALLIGKDNVIASPRVEDLTFVSKHASHS